MNPFRFLNYLLSACQSGGRGLLLLGLLPWAGLANPGDAKLPSVSGPSDGLDAPTVSMKGSFSVLAIAFGSFGSQSARLPALTPPTITGQPISQTITNGATLNLSVTATGSPTLTYQWSLNGAPIPGATAAVLTLFNVQKSLEGNYTCVVSNPYGTDTSQAGVVTVQSAPSIADFGQPQPQTVIQGNTATFTVSPTGDQPFTYQWQLNGTNLPGAMANPLVLVGVQTNQAGNYSVIVSNRFGSVTSSNATLTVNVQVLPTVLTQPVSVEVIAGSNATFSVTAAGSAPLGYQWRFAGVNLPGATGATLTVTNVQATNAGLYSVVVSNPFGTATSSNATLTLKIPPSFLAHPQSLTVLKGTNASFSVTPGGDGPFTYQWRLAGTNLPAATNNPLPLTNVQTNQAGLYSVVIISPYGTATSSNATLTVLDPPVIVVQPASQSVLTGGTATFTVVASGRPTLLYQWRKNGVAITGATNATLTLANVSAADVALYSVVVSNADGTATSVNATLTLSNRTLQVVSVQTTNLTAGAAVAVPVALLAEGGENRVRGSVAYDTAKLAFVSVTSPFTTATLVSTNALGAGQIGFDLTLANGGTLAAGSNVMVFLNFTVAAGVTQSIASLNLQGTPTTNEVLTTAGTQLAAYFLSGAVVFKETGTNAYQLRSQTGATEEALPIFNPAGSSTALTFLRISFHDLGVDSLGNAIRLLNATGTNNGVPFVLIPTTIAPAGTFPLNVEYYVSDRVTSPKPRLVIEVVTGGFPVAPAGTVLAPDRAEFHLGRFKIDFNSLAGKTYYIQYSVSPAGPWDTSFPGVAGTGGRLQWVDTGPPRTTSLPTAAGTRFYRLLQVP